MGWKEKGAKGNIDYKDVLIESNLSNIEHHDRLSTLKCF